MREAASDMAQASLNMVTLLGRLAGDPVIRDAGGEGRMVGFILVTSRWRQEPDTGRNGRKEGWRRVVVVKRRSAAYASTHLREDEQVYLEGELQTVSRHDEIFGVHHFCRIVLWHEGNQLKRMDGPGCSEPASALRRLALVRDCWFFRSGGTAGAAP
jgi:hypothetical protein